MAHITASATPSAGIMARVAGTLASAKARYAQYRIYRSTLSELGQLTDRELADLGLSRSMLRRTAYEAAYM